MTYKKLLKMTIEIVSFPMKKWWFWWFSMVMWLFTRGSFSTIIKFNDIPMIFHEYSDQGWPVSNIDNAIRIFRFFLAIFHWEYINSPQYSSWGMGLLYLPPYICVLYSHQKFPVFFTYHRFYIYFYIPVILSMEYVYLYIYIYVYVICNMCLIHLTSKHITWS